jgi:hypothetical protein
MVDDLNDVAELKINQHTLTGWLLLGKTPKTRYGWVPNCDPTGMFTPQETRSFNSLGTTLPLSAGAMARPSTAG